MQLAIACLKAVSPILKRLHKTASQEDKWAIEAWLPTIGDVIDPRVKQYPSEKAQKAYPLSEFPCSRCEHEHLPFWDPQGDGHWEHQYQGTGRTGCSRFGGNSHGERPRPGTRDGMEEWSIETDHGILEHKYNLVTRENYDLRQQLKEAQQG